MFAVGDVVRLNSGGSRMTVKSVHGEYVECVWQQSDQLKTEQFASAMLKRVVDSASPNKRNDYDPFDRI